MRLRRLDRRTVLRGIGGVAVGLPALEIMDLAAPGAWAATPPRRFVLSYGGISTGADGRSGDNVVPGAVGKHYDVKRGLRALVDLGIRDDVSVVSGLRVPDDGSPGSRPTGFHFNTVGPQIAGTTGKEPRGPTGDQIVARQTPASRVLAYRVQPVYYNNANEDPAQAGSMGILSWKDAGLPQPPTFSPRVAYNELFMGAPLPSSGPASDPAEVKRAQLMIKRKRTVLDLVIGETQALIGRLGASDRQRMERHLESIRQLERGLVSVSGAGPSGTGPGRPADPGSDPDIAPPIKRGYTPAAGYSDEDRRAEVFADLVAYAFATDTARVSSFMLTMWKCYINMINMGGWRSDMHELTHGAAGKDGLDAVADSVSWLVRLWGKLVVKLKALPEAGGTVLDSSALVLLFEGGWGRGEGKTLTAHSTENMVALIAGRAGGLKSGLHVSAPGRHPASAVLTAMKAAGAATDKLGEIAGDIPGLL